MYGPGGAPGAFFVSEHVAAVAVRGAYSEDTMPDPRDTEPARTPVTREDEVLDTDKDKPETEKIEDEGEPLGANFA